MNASKRLNARVYGVVQGVNFRYHTRHTARHLRLVGWVRNRADGSVEVCAEGPLPSLQSLETYLHSGPPSARVDSIVVDWDNATGEFTTFDIR